jgi:hypothetical protein
MEGRRQVSRKTQEMIARVFQAQTLARWRQRCADAGNGNFQIRFIIVPGVLLMPPALNTETAFAAD